MGVYLLKLTSFAKLCVRVYDCVFVFLCASFFLELDPLLSKTSQRAATKSSLFKCIDLKLREEDNGIMFILQFLWEVCV